MTFKEFLEALNFNSPQRSNMQNHPMVTGATVGIEIEFIAAGIPYNDFTPELLTTALKHSKEFHEEAKSKLQIEDDDEDLSDRQLKRYIAANQQEAYQFFRSHLEDGSLQLGKTDSEWQHEVVEYWAEHFITAIQAAKFSAQLGKTATPTTWAIGDDGHDTMYSLPVLEIRSSIIPVANLPQLEMALKNIANVVSQNKQDLLAMGNTGIHVHVHNAGVGRSGQGYDMFGRLAAASYTDENSIWDATAVHDREFERHAMMNRMQDFSHQKKGAHDDIIATLDYLRGRGETNPLIISNQELWHKMSGAYDRNKGTNIVSEHPTVEYRYLTSAILLENNGAKKITDWVKYFIDSSASQVNKTRIKFENDTMRVLLTRMPGDMVRIDFQEPNKTRRVPQTGLARAALTQPQVGRTDQGFADWWKTLSQRDREQYKAKTNRS